MKSLLNALSVVALLAACAAAQRAVAPGFAGGSHLASHSISPVHRSGSLRGGSPNLRRSVPYAPYASLPFPFFSDAFDPDDIYSSGYPVASEPPPYVLEAARQMAGRGSNFSEPNGGATSGAAPGPQPVLIEMQSGRYVRINSNADEGDDEEIHLAGSPSQASSVVSTSEPPVLPPTVLIFRDGHREEVRDYTIANGMLYVRGDFYSDGYWNKQVSLASLNLPATLQANASRNVKFDLPSSPNEVITRF